MTDTSFPIFLVATPGLEAPLLAETRALGWTDAQAEPGGVGFQGGWPDVWRANLWSRGATRVLARIAGFRAMHLAQLDKRARRVDWGAVLRPDRPLRVETTCRKSRIYHAGAATQRIEAAIADTLGAPITPDATLVLKVRIEDDFCTVSIDTSGESLHKRGHKQAVSKAPMRETMAAMLLRDCGYDGAEPVLDPMCGSGTFPIEAAEIATNLAPGRSRSFGFETLASFDPAAWDRMREGAATPRQTDLRFYGRDRDAGAVRMATANADRAGVGGLIDLQQIAVADLPRPDGPPGLVIVNPPYGTRIGNKGLLFAIHAQMGSTLKTRFSGWRVGIVTADAALARATGLPLRAPGPYIAHGGLKIRLWQTGPLP